MQRVLTTVTLLGLLVATAAAFAITEHLKLIKSPVYGTLVSKVFSPVCHCGTSTAAIRFRLRHAGRATVTIVDSGHNRVDTVVSAEMPAHHAHTFRWDGRTSSGARAPDGVYYPWIDLAHGHSTLKLINRIVLDTTTPKVLSAQVQKPVLFAGPGRSVAIRYAFSEGAHAVVYLGHRRLVVGRPTRAAGKIKWSGRIRNHEAAREGTYILSIAARDDAGNESPPAARKRVKVVVRFIELTPRLITARPGARITLHLQTGAPRYVWRLGKRHGERRGKLLRVHAPTTPGTYHLVVSTHGHSATALVRVRTK